MSFYTIRNSRIDFWVRLKAALNQLKKLYCCNLDFVQFYEFLADARLSCDDTRKNPSSRALNSLPHAA